MQFLKKNSIYFFLTIFFFISCLIILFFDGSGDSGDSINHYLYSKFAPKHPELFFNHWAKPFFVFTSFPFAQFGFNGMKLFNVLVTIGTIFCTYKIAQSFKLKHSILSCIIIVFSPLNFVLIFSGLTEPLFALVLSLSVLLLIKKKLSFGTALISFLPFVRSEGLIFLGIFGFYLLIKLEWKIIPLLLLGHIAYSFAGYFVYHDILWVFNKIPYAKLDSTYGDGKLFHFVNQLMYVVGIPIYVLFWLGTLMLIWEGIKKNINLEVHILIFLGFFAFFVAHSLFWYLGIFNSMGLKRVLIGIAPLTAIIALVGFNSLLDLIKEFKPFNIGLKWGMIIYIMIFPFTSNPAAIDWKKDLSVTIEQTAVQEVANFVSKQKCKHYLYSHPYLGYLLEIDHFNPNIRKGLTLTQLDSAKSGTIVVWGNWFSVVEYGITKEKIDNYTNLTNIYNVRKVDGNREILFAVFRVK